MSPTSTAERVGHSGFFLWWGVNLGAHQDFRWYSRTTVSVDINSYLDPIHCKCYCFLFMLLLSSAELKAQVIFFRSHVVRWLSVRLSVNLSKVHLFLQNHCANFNQTWHNASLGEENKFKLIQIKGHAPFQRVIIRKYHNTIIYNYTLMQFKNLHLQNR